MENTHILLKNRLRLLFIVPLGLLLFATACNWFSAGSSIGPQNQPLTSETASTEDLETQPSRAPQVLNADIPAVGDAAKQKKNPDLLSAEQVDASLSDASEAVLQATADAIVAELHQVRIGLDKQLSQNTPSPIEPSGTGRGSAANVGSLLARSQAQPEMDEQRANNVPFQGIVDGDLVNIRSGPNTNYPVVAQANAGMALAITGRNEDGTWWQICCPSQNDEKGWLFGELLTIPSSLVNNTDAVPVVQAPDLPASAVGGNVNPNAQTNVQIAAVSAPGLPAPGGFSQPSATNPLTGQPLPGGRGDQRPVVVCINNDFAARPQFGTSQADVMYEYLMEGYGITRFSGIYYGEDSPQIGPIRSARLINYYMGHLYDAGLVCSGASDGVRYTLKHEAPFPYLDIDLDDPANNRYTSNVGSDYRTRLRTDTEKVRRWLADWGVQKPASIRGFTFGSASGGGQSATIIDIPYPGGSRSGYQYDSGSGLYLRMLSGAPHMDGNNTQQLGLENVIVQYVPHETTDIVEDSLGSLSIRLNLFGTNRAIVFRDGQAFEGIWRSESGGDTPRFFSIDGREIALKPGQTWISVVPMSYTVSYQ